MPTNVKVCINGFVLSTLLFDCTNSSGDQEGFLYGSITRNVRREINDQSMSNTQEDILISICSSSPCGSFLSFYNDIGEIQREDLEYNLGDRLENIVGWYRFRRYSAVFPSLREQTVHRNLRALFGDQNNVNNLYFVFGLLSSSNLPNFATHSYDYAFFMQKRDSVFRDLSLTILNLGDTRNSYRSGSMALPFMNSSSFNSVLSSSWNFSSFYETENQIHQFHQRLRMKLESLQEELAASDAVNASLEDDIRRLSNEMQTLLTTQERLARAAAARELEHTDNEVEVIEREEAEANEREEAEGSEREEVEEDEREAEEASERDGGEETEREEGVSSEGETSKGSERKVVGMRQIPGVSGIIKSSKIDAAISPEKADTESQDSSDSKESEPVINKESDPIHSMDDDSGDNKSFGAKEKAVGSPRLKRASVDPLEGDRSTKRVCPDKYFESGEYLDDKSVTSTADELASSSKQEDSQLLVVDPDSGEMSSAQNGADNLKSEITSGEIEESTVPSPASNVEIVISDAGLQAYGSAMIVMLSEFMINCIVELVVYGLLSFHGFLKGVPVDESISSSDELSDNKESDAKEDLALLNVEESSSVFSVRKSLSDSAISCRKEVTSDRCGSAHAELLSQTTDSAPKDDYKLVFDEGASTLRASTFDESYSKVNPPFIIYASKKPEDQSKDSVQSTSGNSEPMDESNPDGCFTDKPEAETSQSSPSCDQKDNEKKHVPRGSNEKEE